MRLNGPRSSGLLVSMVFALALSLSAAPSITVDHIDGLDASGGIYPGAILTFHMRITGDANAHYVISNGFSISGENVSWTAMTGALNPVYPWDLSFGFPCFFDLGMFVNTFSTGSGADTIGFGGAAGMYGTGLPAGFDDVAYTITIGPLQGTEYTFLELDSAFYRPAGRWVWDLVEENVEWGGPYVYTYCEGCGSPPEPETYLEQDPIILKDLADRVLRVYVANENVGDIDLTSVVVQGKIPPYTTARIEGDLLVTDVFIFRFLSTWRPIAADVQGTYSISYNVNGETKTLFGDVNIQVYPGDLNFDGAEDQQDISYMVDYIWNDGNLPVLEEALDVNRDGYVDVRDLRELVQIVY
ncbi:MAG: dockerin type I domain-containing protein [Candidatus Zixiibacteriota bacterium]